MSLFGANWEFGSNLRQNYATLYLMIHCKEFSGHFNMMKLIRYTKVRLSKSKKQIHFWGKKTIWGQTDPKICNLKSHDLL